MDRFPYEPAPLTRKSVSLTSYLRDVIPTTTRSRPAYPPQGITRADEEPGKTPASPEGSCARLTYTILQAVHSWYRWTLHKTSGRPGWAAPGVLSGEPICAPDGFPSDDLVAKYSTFCINV